LFWRYAHTERDVSNTKVLFVLNSGQVQFLTSFLSQHVGHNLLRG
jgi:hypothetical protein